MTTKQSLKQLNRELRRIDDPDWWTGYTRRIHPARQITAPLVRSSEMQVLAREFFASIAHDKILLERRAQVIITWFLQSQELQAARANRVTNTLVMV
jgi:hypothetical protein